MFSRKTKILLYGSSIWNLGEGMLGPIFGVLTERTGGDILDISWIWATYLMVTGVFTVYVGKFSDKRISKERLMVAGYALNAVFTFGYLFISSSVHLFFVQVGLGVAAALATPTWDALYAKHEDTTKAGNIWGTANGLDQLVTGVAVIVGALIIKFFSFQTLFITMGTVQVLATIFQAQILRK